MTAPAIPVNRVAASQLLLQHYHMTQRTIAQRAALAIQRLWLSIIDPLHFSDSWNQLGPLVNGIISTHHTLTAADAAQYYANARVLADLPHMPVPGQAPDEAYIGNVTGAMGPGQFYHFLGENNDPNLSSTMASNALQGASSRMVMLGGRDTVTSAAALDPAAEGWERVIQPGSCGFCAMLAGRGAVYKAGTADFRAHDHCHCVARVVFKGQESVNTALSEQWGRATKGTSGKAAIAAWNAHWERTGGGLNVEPEHGPAKVPAEVGTGHGAIEPERKR
jgi:hypothetical protein